MKISEIAQRLNTSVRTLRFYEEQGLVHPRRKPSGTRVYSAANEGRFAAFLGLARLGFSLNSLAELAGIRRASATGDEASRKVAKRLTEIENELAERARAIKYQRADIKKALVLVTQCHNCQQRPIRSVCAQCPVSAELEDIGVLQLVWDEEMPCLCDKCNQPL